MEVIEAIGAIGWGAMMAFYGSRWLFRKEPLDEQSDEIDDLFPVNKSFNYERNSNKKLPKSFEKRLYTVERTLDLIAFIACGYVFHRFTSGL